MQKKDKFMKKVSAKYSFCGCFRLINAQFTYCTSYIKQFDFVF